MSLFRNLLHLPLALVALALVATSWLSPSSLAENVNEQTVLALAATTFVGVVLIRAEAFLEISEDATKEGMSSQVWLERAFGLAGSCAWSALLLRLLSSSPNLLPPSCTLYLCVATTLLTLASFLHHALITITTSQPPCPTLSLPLYVLDSKQDLPNVSSASVADPEPTPLLDAALTSFIALWSSLTLVFSLVLVFVTRSDRSAGLLSLPSALALASVILPRHFRPSLISTALLLQTYAALTFSLNYTSWTLPACRQLLDASSENVPSSFAPDHLACTLSTLAEFASRLVLVALVVRVAVDCCRGESNRLAAAVVKEEERGVTIVEKR